ncbi:hypothetical protein [Embleya scabrispora]|uniref:hypothetical protein n=1 Tax=Embleya scabrispora TaxID=159449 RepID=UPI00039A14E3|nr:hypothetical protein [Embleya scabrispora]MYS85941.1 hypothetical protein [Streptomyces sp. SID5474]
MDTDEHEGARLLAALRATPQTAPDEPGVNVARAIREGRRTVRVRRALAVTGGAVAVALVVLATVLIAAPLHNGAIGPAAGGTFDVGQRAFNVGSGGGFTPVLYETGKYRQRVVLGTEKPGGPPEVAATRATVTMYAPDRLPGGEAGLGAPAPPVNGRPAAWLTGPDPVEGRIQLAWQWMSGAWGIASLAGPAADAERVRAVAESVAAGSRRPIGVPVKLDRDLLAAGEHLTSVVASVGRPPDASVYALRFGAIDPPNLDGTDPPWFSVGIGKPPIGDDGRGPDRVTRADGAFVESDPPLDRTRLSAILAGIRTDGYPSAGPTAPTDPPSSADSESPSTPPFGPETSATSTGQAGTAPNPTTSGTPGPGTSTSTSPGTVSTTTDGPTTHS